MNVKTTKKPQPRYDVSWSQRFNMQQWGGDNLYPQHLQRITSASGTAELCLNRYAKFIEGYGFNSELLSNSVVNRWGETADDILHLVAQDVARFGGFALHVNYNALCEVSEINFIPFEQCRLEEPDDAGYVGRILVHEDWYGCKTKNGKKMQVTEANIKRIAVFNPDPDVVARQIENSGGVANYSGQILWASMDGKYNYPTPIYDAAVTELSTDEGLGNLKNRNVRNNFIVACMLITKKGVPKLDEYGNEVSASMIEDEDLRAFQGDERSSKIMVVELENDEDKPEVVQFPTTNIDKEFTVTDESVIERIYAQFHQELFYSIRMGKLGFSGQVMQDAYRYYAGEVTNEQRFISRNFAKVFSVFNSAVISNESDYYLQPLKYVTEEGEINE